MPESRIIRLFSATLMVLALTLPVASPEAGREESQLTPEVTPTVLVLERPLIDCVDMRTPEGIAFKVTPTRIARC